MKITLTIDTDRLAKFGDSGESAEAFIARMLHEQRTGGSFVWMLNRANVGTIDRVTA